MTNDFDELDPLLNVDDAPEPPQDSFLVELDASARSIDPWTALGAWPDSPVEENELQYWVPTFDGVDLLGEARAQLTSPTQWGIDRWAYERVLSVPGLVEQAQGAAEEVDGTQYWFEPDAVELWFLPTASAHLMAAYVNYFPTMGREEILSAALWRWNHTRGAGLVAVWGQCSSSKLPVVPPLVRRPGSLRGNSRTSRPTWTIPGGWSRCS